MNLSHAMRTTAAILILSPIAALAQEDPEGVYARMHKAAIAGNSDEVLSFASAKQKADLAAKPKAEKDAVIQFMSKLMPRSYAITAKTITPDGSKAVLRGTGTGGIGNSPMYLNADFVKEGGAWKVDQWGWSSDKPTAVAAATPEPKPAAKAEKADAKATPAPAAKAEGQATAPQAAAVPVAAAAPRRRSRATEDARECLRFLTNTEIAKCAEKFR